MSSRILEEIKSMGFEALKTLEKACQQAPGDKLLKYMVSKCQKYNEKTISDDDDVDIDQPESEQAEEDTIEQVSTITKVPPLIKIQST